MHLYEHIYICNFTCIQVPLHYDPITFMPPAQAVPGLSPFLRRAQLPCVEAAKGGALEDWAPTGFRVKVLGFRVQGFRVSGFRD